MRIVAPRNLFIDRDLQCDRDLLSRLHHC